MRKIIVTFDYSQEDIPTLLIGHENFSFMMSSPSFTVDNIITGIRAEELWDELNMRKNNEE